MANSQFESFYFRAPVFLQNLAVTAKGFLLNKNRKSGNYRKYKQAIAARSNWKITEFQKHQLQECRSLINYACQHVPYYRQTYGSMGLSADNLCKISDLQKFPVLSRSTVKQSPADFLSDEFHSSKKLSLHTTGTTGSPLKIMCDQNARQINYAFFDNFLESIGINPEARHIILGGRVIVSPNSASPPFWRYSHFQNSLLMSSYHLHDRSLDAYLDMIDSYKPEYIESYPSSIYTLARYLLANDRRLHCKAIVTSAETLSHEQRDIIEEAFNTRVYDQYGCAEMCVFISQCTHGRYHLRPDYGVLEIVDDDGMPVPDGQSGQVLCTGFVNKMMPLLRYSIGDISAFSTDTSCECGLMTPLIKEIQGRTDDILLTRDGRPIGRVSPILKGFPIREAQYVQYVPGELEILVVPDSEFVQERDIAQIIDAARMRIGKDDIIRIRLVDKIERGKGGKLKAVISHVNKPHNQGLV